MSYVVEINDLEELAGYRLVWNSLLPDTPGASFFHTLDWLEAYWQHYGQGQRLRVLIVYALDRPIGILPLCVRTEQYQLGGLRVLTYPLHDWAAFYGPIGPHPTATLLAGLRHVRATRRDWDLMDLRWTNTDGWDHGRTECAMQEVGFHPHKQAWAQTAVIDFSQTWEQYLAGRSNRWRTNFRRNQRRLSELGEITHVRYRPQGISLGEGDPRWDLYDACEAVAARSWQGSSPDGTTLSHATVRPFLREAHRLAAKRGMVDINLLTVDGHPVAFAYNYHYAGHLQALRIGFDPELGHRGSGTILYAWTIRDSIARGDRAYDLGPGSLDWKQHLLTQLQTSYRYTHFPLSVVRAQALRAKRLITSWWSRERATGPTTEAAAQAPATAEVKPLPEMVGSS